MSIETGGPAFPGSGEIFITGPQGLGRQSEWGMQGDPGMTLRDYFAAKAMQGCLADPTMDQVGSEKISRFSYLIADAMLAERAKAQSAQDGV